MSMHLLRIIIIHFEVGFIVQIQILFPARGSSYHVAY